MRSPFFSTFVSTLLLASAPVLAEETTDTTVLPEIRVNAEESLTAPSIEKARERVNSVAGGASVKDGEEIRKGRASTLKDALDFTPGVMVQSRFGAEEARLSIRGSGIQRTFHGSGLTVLQDGVPLNLADGSFDMQAIEPLSSRYIEVFRGANALQYGSTTNGGAINFVSPSGYESDLLRARAEYGSFKYTRGQIFSGQVLGAFDYAASLTHFSQDGFRQHSEQSTQRFFGNTGWKIDPQVESRLFFTYVRTDSELPGNLTKAQLNADPTLPATSNVTNDWQRNFKLFRIADKTTYSLGEGSRIEGSVFWSRKDLHHPIVIVIDQEAEDFGGDLKYVRKGFSLGLRSTFGTIHDERFVNSGGNSGAKTADADLSASNVSLYSELETPVHDSVSILAGVQGSYSRRAEKDNFPVSGSDLDNSDTKEFWGVSPKLGARYDLNPFTQVFSNISRSFEPPTWGELVAVSGQNGLLDLDASTATTFELGSRGSEGRFAWDVSYYYAWIRKELLQYEISPGLNRTLNAGKTSHQGVEFGMKAGFLDPIGSEGGSANYRLLFTQSYNWSDFRFSGDPTYGNNRMAGMPRHFYRAELMYQDPLGYYFGPNLEKVFGKYPVDFANTLYADPYTLLGFKVGYRSKAGFSGFLEGRNLTNAKYAATTGVIARATGSNQSQFMPGDGRSVYAGLEWRL